MKNKLFLLVLALFLTACNPEPEKPPETPQAVTENPATDPYRLDPNVQPTFQHISFRMDPSQADYTGSTTIELDIANPSKEIRLHAFEIDVDALSLTQGEQEMPVTFRSGEHGILFIESSEDLPAGSYTLNIGFTNNFNTNGEAINRTEHEGDSYVFSQFEAIHARESFPCFDEPGYKYPWQLTIAVPGDVTVVTNTPIVAISEADGWVTTEFDRTPALPSYLIAVAIGPF